MLAGPLFHREVLTTPRQWQHFVLRAGYVSALAVLVYTFGQTTFGWRQALGVGEVARFGTLLFQVFSSLQMALALFFAPLFAASRVAQEKDRQTLILLLMTDLRDRELVLGKLLASLLPMAVLLGVSAPVLGFVTLLGGTSWTQVGWSIALCAITAFVAGSWGSLVAFWREKTFQTLAISAIGIPLFLGIIEAVIFLLGSQSAMGQTLSLLNPFRGLWMVLDPLAALPDATVETIPVGQYLLALAGLAFVLNAIAVVRLRVWNPSRSVYEAARMKTAQEIEAATTRGATRAVWNVPIIWREIRTRAYGRKTIFIKLAYALLVGLSGLYLHQVERSGATELVLGIFPPHGALFLALSFLALLLVNAQSVTALTNERDARTLELLLVTDISAQEFIFGKLGGVFYNAKEVLLLPVLGLVYFGIQHWISWENFVYLTVGYIILMVFSATLGLHSALSFENSRSAIGNSLGTLFFLFLGTFICLMLIVEARSSFVLQLPSFLVFILGGSLGLWASLTHKNPSSALALSALLLPFFTFYAVTGFLLQDSLGICLVVLATYGFTVLAMLVPAVSEFDAALGRTTLDKG